MMSTQPFDAARYKAGQRREWDTAAPGLKDWGLVIGPELQPVSERMLELAPASPLSPLHIELGLQAMSSPPTSHLRWSRWAENESWS